MPVFTSIIQTLFPPHVATKFDVEDGWNAAYHTCNEKQNRHVYVNKQYKKTDRHYLRGNVCCIFVSLGVASQKMTGKEFHSQKFLFVKNVRAIIANKFYMIWNVEYLFGEHGDHNTSSVQRSRVVMNSKKCLINSQYMSRINYSSTVN